MKKVYLLLLHLLCITCESKDDEPEIDPTEDPAKTWVVVNTIDPINGKSIKEKWVATNVGKINSSPIGISWVFENDGETRFNNADPERFSIFSKHTTPMKEEPRVYQMDMMGTQGTCFLYIYADAAKTTTVGDRFEPGILHK